MATLRVTAAVLTVAQFVLVGSRLGPPAPRGPDAPLSEFSAARAFATLQKLLGDQAPHPFATPANAAVRGRLRAELAALGIQFEEHLSPAIPARRGAPHLHNVLARIPGAQDGPAVMLAAHYDSVRAGPGASDDGVGVATLLEVARCLTSGPRPRRPVALLFTDGEEAGLLGARAFRATREAAGIGAVLNFEARGTGGASLMFETSGENGWLIELFARACRRPVTSSGFATVYERMPNGTDLSEFRRAGIPGLNFAFIEGAVHYHRATDDLAHVDLGSLQHHGDNALAMVRALCDSDLGADRRGRGDAVFFDVLALFVVAWPVGWSLWAAVLALVAVAVLAARVVRSAHAAGLPVAVGEWFGVLCLPAASGWLLDAALRGLGWLDAPFVESPLGYHLGFWGAAVVVVAGFARLTRSATPWARFIAVWCGAGVVAVVVAAVIPTFVYLWLVPLLVALLAALPAALRRRPEPGHAAHLAPLLAAGIVWFPVIQLIPVALGLFAGVVISGVAGGFLPAAVWVLHRRPEPAT